jgi:hypothetical protein
MEQGGGEEEEMSTNIGRRKFNFCSDEILGVNP